MKNKILPIFCILILCSFIFINNNVFAATYDLSDYINHTAPGVAWCLVYSKNNNTFYMVATESSYIMFHGITVENNRYICGSGEVTCTNSLSDPYGNQGNYVVYYYNSETNAFDTYTTHTQYSHFEGGTCELIASNIDIYSSWDTSIFFQETPVPSMVVIPQTLAETLEEAQAVKKFQTMMSGIIPYLIALVVGLVAFWKAWQLLLKELRKA